MRDRIVKTIPEHMVALSLLPPPHAFEPLRPFGFGAFVITRLGPDGAKFSLHVHGYGAGYEPQRIRRDIRSLFTPETRSLTYMPAPPYVHGQRFAKAKFPSTFLDLVPRVGLLSNVFAALPRDMLAHSAGIAGLSISGAIRRRYSGSASLAPKHRLLGSTGCSSRARRTFDAACLPVIQPGKPSNGHAR